MRSVSIMQAAKMLNVSRRTVYSRIDSGRLRIIRVGASQRVLLASIEAERGKKYQRVMPMMSVYPYPYGER